MKLKNVKYLLEKGVDVHAITDDGWTAFAALACYQTQINWVGDSVEIVHLLLTYGAIDIPNPQNGKTLLGWATENPEWAAKNSDIMDMLNLAQQGGGGGGDIAKSAQHEDEIPGLKRARMQRDPSGNPSPSKQQMSGDGGGGGQ